MRFILTNPHELVNQARIAEAAYKAGRPTGNPAIRIYEIGDRYYVAYYNKKSITIHTQP